MKKNNERNCMKHYQDDTESKEIKPKNTGLKYLKLILLLLFWAVPVVFAGECDAVLREQPDQQAPSLELCAKRDELYRELQTLVAALEKNGIDVGDIGFENFHRLSERGKRAIDSIFKECVSLEKRAAILQKEWDLVAKEEREFFGMIEKLEKVVAEVVDLQADKDEKKTKCFKVDKLSLIGILGLGGTIASGLLLAALLRL